MAEKFLTSRPGHPKSRLMFLGEDGKPELSRAKQEFRDECDINVIAKKAEAGGFLAQSQAPIYGDFTQYGDFKAACDLVLQAEELFLDIPASIRERFDNDPAKFMEFASNADNAEELVKMGLATHREGAKPADAPEPSQTPKKGKKEEVTE